MRRWRQTREWNIHKPRKARGGWQAPESRREAWDRFSKSPEGTNADDSLILDFWHPEL